MIGDFKAFIRGIVAPVLKNTNAPLILIVCDVIFCVREKHYNGRFLGVF